MDLALPGKGPGLALYCAWLLCLAGAVGGQAGARFDGWCVAWTVGGQTRRQAVCGVAPAGQRGVRLWGRCRGEAMAISEATLAMGEAEG